MASSKMVVNAIIHCATLAGLGWLMSRWLERKYWILVWAATGSGAGLAFWVGEFVGRVSIPVLFPAGILAADAVAAGIAPARVGPVVVRRRHRRYGAVHRRLGLPGGGSRVCTRGASHLAAAENLETADSDVGRLRRP